MLMNKFNKIGPVLSPESFGYCFTYAEYVSLSAAESLASAASAASSLKTPSTGAEGRAAGHVLCHEQTTAQEIGGQQGRAVGVFALDGQGARVLHLARAVVLATMDGSAVLALIGVGAVDAWHGEKLLHAWLVP